MENLYEKLKKYAKQNIYPMHMPGHKRKTGIFSQLDITEIDGFDNLLSPSGIIRDMEMETARLFGADRAYLSVNGSTGAILAAISALCSREDEIIMARNCHKSVYNAVSIMGLKPNYAFPDYDEYGIAKGLSKEQIEMAIMQSPNAKLIIITSPTYEGILSDIRGICDAAHKKNIPVFVDSAHGAHMKFMGIESAMDCNADAAAVSLHKTLPSMTQTALLLTKGERVNPSVIREKMNVFQTSSPSYVLLASIGECLEFLEDKEPFETYKKNLGEFYGKAKELKKLKLREEENADRGKIVILTGKTDISGKGLMQILRDKYKIELEMAYDNYALAMTSVCDGKSDFDRLYMALSEIDKRLKVGEFQSKSYPKPKMAEIDGNLETEFVSIRSAENRICGDVIWAYPPGVPIIARGELIDKDTLDYLLNLKDTSLFGEHGSNSDKILVFI